MAILINDNYSLSANKPFDNRYLNISTPWANCAAAIAGIPTYRYSGLTVNIAGEEYWWKDGLGDTDLIPKILGGSSYISGVTNGLSLYSGDTQVGLGGILTQNTTICGGYSVNFSGLTAMSAITPTFYIGDSGNNSSISFLHDQDTPHYDVCLFADNASSCAAINLDVEVSGGSFCVYNAPNANCYSNICLITTDINQAIFDVNSRNTEMIYANEAWISTTCRISCNALVKCDDATQNIKTIMDYGNRCFAFNVNDVSVLSILSGGTARYGTGTTVSDDYDLTYKSYVDNLIDVGNGLTKSGNTIILGGTLTGNTCINISGNTFDIYGNNSGSIPSIQLNGSGNSVTINGGNGIAVFENNSIILKPASTGSDCLNIGLPYTTYTSTGGTGIRYGGDYESTFVDRSLVTKKYVTSQISGITGAVTSAENGLCLSGSTVVLGGTLTGDTVINGDSTLCLSFINLSGITTCSEINSTCANTSMSIRTPSYIVRNNTGNVISISSACNIFSDSINSRGFVYGSNYCAVGKTNPRWIPDNAYITGLTSQSIKTANNGLTKTGQNVALGGTLTGNTKICGGGSYSLCVVNSGATTCSLAEFNPTNINICTKNVNSPYQLSKLSTSVSGTIMCHGFTNCYSCLNMTNSQINLLFCGGSSSACFIVTDATSTPRGIEYASDYSDTYSNRSLVDKEYVDNIVAAFNVHESVAIGTTESDGDIILSGLTGTIDSISVSAITSINNRILVKNQTDGAENGIYSASTGNWGRTSDYDFSLSGKISNGDIIPISSGNTNANSQWILVSSNPIISGDTLTFSYFGQQQTISEGNGICVTTVGTNKQVAVKLAETNPGLCFDSTALNINYDIFSSGLTVNSGNTYVNACTVGAIGTEIPVRFDATCNLVVDSCDFQTVTANNGITLVGSNLGLGGALTGNTTISGGSGAYNFNLVQLNSFALGFDNGAIITDNSGTPHGICYASDYSTGYTNRSLVDKEYVDLAISGGVSGITASAITGATNGLTKVGQTVCLGGNLSGNTIINTCGSTLCINVSDNSYARFNQDAIIFQSNCAYIDIDGLTNCIDIYTSNTGATSYSHIISHEGDLCLSFTSGGTVYDQSVNAYGLLYQTGITYNFIDNSLITKNYVDLAISGATSGFTDTGIGWSNLTNGSTVAGCGTVVSGSTIICNTFYGVNAGKSITTGYGNVVIGYNSLSATTIGYNNIGIGNYNLYNNIDGYDNIAIGCRSLFSNTFGWSNVGIGYQSLMSNIWGWSNIGIGNFTLSANTTGNNNIAMGCCSLYNNITGNNNIAMGFHSFKNNTTGCDNIGIGIKSLCNNTIGKRNIGIGSLPLRGNITGSDNIAMGCCSLYYNTSGSSNIGIGNNAIAGSTNTGCYNIGLGFYSISNNEIGNYNIGIGRYTLNNSRTGSTNIAIGHCAGYSEIGSNKLHIANNGTESLIYGEFDNKMLKICGCLCISDLPAKTTETCAIYIDSNGKLSTGVVNSDTGSTGGGITGATNGLTKVGQDVCLGGTLSGNIILDGSVSGAGVDICNNCGYASFTSSMMYIEANGSYISAEPTGCVDLYSTNGGAHFAHVFLKEGDLCLNFTSGGTVYDQSVNAYGLVYQTGITYNFIDRSLITKEYVDLAISGGVSGITASAITGATNGLTKVGQTVCLGGNLSGNTIINTCGSTLCIINSNNSYAQFDNNIIYFQSNCSFIDIDGPTNCIDIYTSNIGATSYSHIISHEGDLCLSFTSGGTVHDQSVNAYGLVYQTGITYNFIDRSLVDKEYVDTCVNAFTYPMTVVTTGVTLTTGSSYVQLINSPTTGITVTLPPTPINGQAFKIKDAANAALSYPITIARNGKLIDNVTSDGTINTDGGALELVYNNALGSWFIMSIV